MVLQNVKVLRSFGDCAAYYEKAHQWRTLAGREEAYSEHSGIQIEPGFKAHPQGSRALDPHNHKRYLSIRPIENGEGYACRYRNTDVVVWRSGSNPNTEGRGETVTVRGYSSRSTALMAENLTPLGIDFNMHYDDDYFAVVKGRVYGFDKTITFAARNEWLPVDHTYKLTFIDYSSPALQNALNKTRYKDFVAWLNAVMSFDQLPVSYNNGSPRDIIERADDEIATHGVLGLLQDVSKWEHLKNFHGWIDNENPRSVLARADRIKREIREHIYREFKAVPVREVEWYDADQFDRQRHLHEKYSWALV
jgi:hypothetical protein